MADLLVLVHHLLRGKLLSNIKGPLSMLRFMERRVGRYPPNTTKCCSFDHPIYGNQSLSQNYVGFILLLTKL